MTAYRIDMVVPVTIEVNNPDVIDRVLNNHDDEGNPQPVDRPRGSFTLDARGWRDTYYDYDTRDQVLKHLAFNAVCNGADDVTRLDGWADMDADACQMTVHRREIEYGSIDEVAS